MRSGDYTENGALSRTIQIKGEYFSLIVFIIKHHSIYSKIIIIIILFNINFTKKLRGLFV